MVGGVEEEEEGGQSLVIGQGQEVEGEEGGGVGGGVGGD